MILKTFILLIGVLLAASLLLRRPQAKLTGRIVITSLIAPGILV
jgi:hypothetical protein